jgi:hypothetical protein
MSRRRSITVGGASRDGLTSLGLVATLGRLSSHQRLLRLAILAGPSLTLAATMAARGSFQPIALMVIGVLAIGCAISPDSHVGLLVVLLLALNWVQTVDDETTPWLLVAAAGLLVLHASMACQVAAATLWFAALALASSACTRLVAGTPASRMGSRSVGAAPASAGAPWPA